MFEMPPRDAAAAIAEFQAGMNARFARFKEVSGQATGMLPSPAKLTAILGVTQLLNEIQAFVESYAARAAELQRAGAAELANSLQAATNDIKGAVALYGEMYADTVTALRSSGQLISDAQADAARSMVELTKAAQERFYATMRQFTA
jgi:hypothetical protein